MSYTRFAIYYVPPEGPLADFGATWLGWDILNGRTAVQPDLTGLHDITMTPRKYGLHGTLKPPFRLKDGQTQNGLEQSISKLATSTAPAACDRLALKKIGKFLALVPEGPMDELSRVAEACVRDIDAFRAPSGADELARRRQAGLSARQDSLLVRWGYPYVFEEFRFHMTLSGAMPEDAMQSWTAILQSRLPNLPTPFVVDQIALCGERQDGNFELIHRYALTG